jgi:hypothetical protein
MKNQRRRSLLIAGSAIASILLPAKVTAQSSNNRTINLMTDSATIINTINQIAIMSDLRNWEACRAAFSDRVETDYTSLTGGQPSTVNAEDLVNSWKTFFDQTFKATQHLIGSHAVTVMENTAICLSNFQAHHIYLDSAKETWTLGGFYEHGLTRTTSGWQVNRMKMSWNWEEGTRPF